MSKARISMLSAVIVVLAGCGGDISTARDEVSKHLNDAKSAEFRNDRVLYVPPDKKKIVCGEVNAKNLYGAYVGFRRYVVEGLDTVPFARFSDASQSDIAITCSLGKT